MRIYVARRIHTMDDSLPHATAVGVIGDLDSMAPWREGREVIIDNHVHHFLGALLTPRGC